MFLHSLGGGSLPAPHDYNRRHRGKRREHSAKGYSNKTFIKSTSYMPLTGLGDKTKMLLIEKYYQ